MPVTLLCQTCKTTFDADPYEARAGRKFCSPQCHYMSKWKGHTFNGDGTVSINLGHGFVTVIDADDFDLVRHVVWGPTRRRGHVYAHIMRGSKSIRMHQVLLDIPDGMFGDHVDGDTLNNRRSNLRICTRAQNAWNQAARNGRRYKGVERTASGRYQARIRVHGTRHNLGTYDTEEEAAAAYDAAAVFHYGEFARLNQPNRKEL